MSQSEMDKAAENYRRQLHGMPPLDDDNGKRKNQTMEEKLKKLKGEPYWCGKCKDIHLLRDRKYRKHVKYTE